MKYGILVVPFIAFLGCGGSDADAPDAKAGADVRPTADTGKTDLPLPPADAAADQAKPDAADAAKDRAADLIDVRADDVAGYRDLPAAEAAGLDTVAAPDAADVAADRPQGETGSGLDGGKSDGGIGLDGAIADGGESCTCDRDLSWACFCSVENCGRTLADFVDYGDGGKAVRTGQQTVVVLEYAACNLVLVRAQTYSDYVPASEYVFERSTGTLVGATVQLDDRQHTCPWSGDARWVFQYTSGTRVPASCAPSACLPGEGSCASAIDAQ